VSQGSPHRNIRFPREDLWLWDAAKQIAQSQGSDLSSVIRSFLRDYIAQHEKRER
jgi:hypothetical protein